MMMLIGKTIMSTTVEDARWLEGESLMDTMQSPLAFGKKMRIHFEDGTYLDVEPVKDRFGTDMIGARMGTWVDNNGVIEVTS